MSVHCFVYAHSLRIPNIVRFLLMKHDKETVSQVFWMNDWFLLKAVDVLLTIIRILIILKARVK
jgi:hypothetical protein